ncbi:DUF6355 family natural product biosynthesis protein [Psychromicrobium sp. YIM B11713]|uniref:DUF6355 family natural product biosynthesis protein n=1 Tax=Psychromicrobium sp. YIM B11713 TaxID=3145233 RepID=UPI00374E52B2
MSLKRTATTVLAAAVLGSGLLVGTAQMSAAVPAAAQRCGFYMDGIIAVYNHCQNNTVKIQIDHIIGNETKCLGPGIHDIGTNVPGAAPWDWVTNAFAIGYC